jgi:hypothetical protein
MYPIKGQPITRLLGFNYSDHAEFIHINLAVPPPDFDTSTTNLTELDKFGIERLEEFAATGDGYMTLQRTKV